MCSLLQMYTKNNEHAKQAQLRREERAERTWVREHAPQWLTPDRAKDRSQGDSV